APHADRQELLAALDEEMQRLPQRYRQLLVMCYLQGKTHDQAARELGWPRGSMSRHLNRALELMRERLRHRGVVATCAGLAGVRADQAARRAVSPAWLNPTLRAALALGDGPLSSCGFVSRRVLSLVQETLPALAGNRSRIAAVLVLLAVFGVGLAGAV